jgi:DHA2 family multidrug resistance protein
MANENKPLEGLSLFIAALMLSAANFVAVLNINVANVALPNISGDLGATMSQGTWVVTSYAVGEAITVPLTGWFVARFGSIRLFIIAMVMFGLTAILCASSNTLGMLVFARVLQGFAGGPLMPLSQTLLLRIFPKERGGFAIGMWSMTTTLGPAFGPVVGGYLCDEYHWNYVFLISVPISIICAGFVWILLRRYTDELRKNPIDVVGLALLIIWVASLQIMLDSGKDLDWFASNEIRTLFVVTLISFCLFLIWEWYEEHPIVDLKVFRHRGFTVSIVTISLAFAAYFSIFVITPLWLQNFMGYTATNAGFVTCWIGISAVIVSPMVAKMVDKVDGRKLVFFGVMLMGFAAIIRSISTTDIDYWHIAIPISMIGIGLPFFFIPTTKLALGNVEPHEVYSAAGMMNFLRTIAGAIAASVVTSSWSNDIILRHAQLVDIMGNRDISMIKEQANSLMQGYQMLDRIITQQAVMLATNDMMLYIGASFIVAASVIWLAPKPQGKKSKIKKYFRLYKRLFLLKRSYAKANS